MNRSVDLRHFLDERGALPPVDHPAHPHAVYYTQIVADATSCLDDPPSIACRCRSARRPCTGLLVTFPDPDDLAAIGWYCPVCHDGGTITGWQETLWDGTAVVGRS
ncbi:MAG: hypothetical protein O9284_13165 [Steroidobacteraceae bacterium]|jgi:hypothetical protein|nr:hypothetical protein [Steroidobacteraceae bacterium]